MNKRSVTYVVMSVLVLGVAGALILMLTRTDKAQTPEPAVSDSPLTSNRYAEARVSPTNGVACLEEDSAITIRAEERTEIEYASMGHVYDVPAGTYLDVKIASYSDEKVTGSNLYEGDYGNYNFVLSKQDGKWAVTEYKRCEL